MNQRGTRSATVSLEISYPIKKIYSNPVLGVDHDSVLNGALETMVNLARHLVSELSITLDSILPSSTQQRTSGSHGRHPSAQATLRKT